MAGQSGLTGIIGPGDIGYGARLKPGTRYTYTADSQTSYLVWFETLSLVLPVYLNKSASSPPSDLNQGQPGNTQQRKNI